MAHLPGPAPTASSPLLALLLVLALARLALTAGLAVACFVRAFGITFLALPRGDAAAGPTRRPSRCARPWCSSPSPVSALASGALPVLPRRRGGGRAGAGVAPEPPALRHWLTLQTPAGLARLSPRRDRGAACRARSRRAGAWSASWARAGPSPRRDVGLRPAAPDGAHGVQRDLLRRAATSASSSSSTARPRREVEHHPESRFFVRTIAGSRQHPARVRGLALPAGAGLRPAAPAARAHPVRLEPLPHLRAASPSAAARVLLATARRDRDWARSRSLLGQAAPACPGAGLIRLIRRSRPGCGRRGAPRVAALRSIW